MKRRVLALALAALAGSALAADEPRLRRSDPWVAPEARFRSAEPPAEGAALDAQALAKLKRRFDAADAQRSGAISRAQAERAGLGFVARHFEQIDRRASGSISFEDLQRYLAERERVR
ncbi:EF-hand domain-containing protein [Aquincola sp. S2]|uniref:EF-hand domain-containing protein n=1 Tax=Pseudaquabacterium terrae TaxID=2732868 RepID=A0ABX2EQI6_9BURK|nr:EF-hand domain-containing protein [Aquabacterium terrae]NRF70917.1 EF-hand domain-containing protein [Aquabacterium terrae]